VASGLDGFAQFAPVQPAVGLDQQFGLDVELTISLPGLERDVAQAIVDQAHIVCPYSDATRKGLDVRLKLN